MFPSPVLEELRVAGWTPDREIDISAWEAELGSQGYHLTDIAAESLRSFGGLEIGPVNTEGPNFSNDEPLNVDPILAGSGHFALAEELSQELGDVWYPFAEWLSSSSVFVGASGHVVATGLGWIWELGESVEDAIRFALMADHPLRCLRVLAPGAKPWPPQLT
ncbi:SUKH-3 domain-containing protein [Amycolatopsis sp. NPDC051128]|uniref:SUKH-3 domain-containing protein n=1 Tax=Amycolatopsis sp. NPDC051128 TaxID=3155412 RepID=UPI0034294A26